MNDLIKKIIKTAKDKIDSAGCTTVDHIARHYCDMLDELGEKDAMMEVYRKYIDIMRKNGVIKE